MDKNIQRVLQDAMTPTVAADFANVTRATIYNWIRWGWLTAYQSSAGSMVVMRSDLECTLKNKLGQHGN